MCALLRATWLALAALTLSACASSLVQGEGSPEAPVQPVSRLVAYVTGPNSLVSSFQANIAVEAARHGLAAENALLLFPPTHAYADLAIRQGLATRSIDGVLIINVGDAGVQREYAGTIFQGRSPVSSGPAEAAIASVHGYPRPATFTARLLDAATGRRLWEGAGQFGDNKGLFGQNKGLFSFDAGPTVSESVAVLFDDLQAKGIVAPHDSGRS
jgi:hypothetical protein